MEYMLTFHILNVYVDKTQPHQFKFTFNKTRITFHIIYMQCASLQLDCKEHSDWETSKPVTGLPNRLFPNNISMVRLVNAIKITGHITTFFI